MVPGINPINFRSMPILLSPFPSPPKGSPALPVVPVVPCVPVLVPRPFKRFPMAAVPLPSPVPVLEFGVIAFAGLFFIGFDFVGVLGVALTICYTDFTRKEDFRKHEQELKEEYEKRNNDTKINLSAQYKPILTVTFDSNYIDDIKFGMSKRPKFYIENTLSLNGKMEIQFNKKRISISLYVLNIGRGEANNIKISSLILDSKGSTWDTELRTYKEIATSSGICLMFYKELSEREWKEYSNKMLEEPFKMCIDIEYDDLVGFHHKLNSLLMVKRFVHIRDEDNNVIENVLVINPYDSTIQNMTSIDS